MMCKLKIVRDLNFQAENKLNYKNMPIAYINLFGFFFFWERVLFYHVALPQTHSNTPASAHEDYITGENLHIWMW